jgi:hypothetical protein
MADQNDSSDKRKTQNRIAQRHFRDRRAQKCNDLEIENTQLKETHRVEMSALREQLMQRDAHIAALLAEKVDAVAERACVDTECNGLRERNVVLQRELGMFHILPDILTLHGIYTNHPTQMQPSFIMPMLMLLTPSALLLHQTLSHQFIKYSLPHRTTTPTTSMK